MSIDAVKLKEAFIQAAYNLKANEDYINTLNVFPVPDGDTGSNMSMTIMQAVDSVNALSEITIENVASAIQQGSLRGARGNSGVILSQLLRGFCNRIKEEKYLTEEIFLDAIICACDAAYKAVIKPKEGTILTVARGLSDKAKELKRGKHAFNEILIELVKYGDEVLAKTPDMLPVLKEAGVVDSGGQGLMELIRGILKYSNGEEIEVNIQTNTQKRNEVVDRELYKKSTFKFEYCTECIINAKDKFTANEDEILKKFLDTIGDSIVVVKDTDCMKVHVHTNHPGLVFEKGLEFGFLSNLKVDNLKLEHNEVLIKNATQNANSIQTKNNSKKTKFEFIVVSSGEGLKKIFKDFGVNTIIEGGQTMNPSTSDFLDAIEKLNTENIFILPNNSNIIMAANQSAEIAKDKKVHVIPTKNIVQGIEALAFFTEKENVKDMVDEMKENIANVKCIQTTYAVRDTVIDGIEVKENDYISIGDDGLLASSKNMSDSIQEALLKTVSKNHEILTIYYGKDVKEKDAMKLKKDLEKIFPDLEIEIYEGSQPVYYYFFAIE